MGQQYEWTLPIVSGAYMNSYVIEMFPDEALKSYLTFNKETNMVSFNDSDDSNQLIELYHEIWYTIVDSRGNSNSVVQHVQVKAKSTD